MTHTVCAAQPINYGGALREPVPLRYTRRARRQPTPERLLEPLPELGDMALLGRVPVEVQRQ